MGLNPSTRYPTKTAAPSPQYPWGSARNVTNPGDGTGTPWEQDVVNDLFGMQQALLSGLGYSPSGFPDQVGASQYMAAIVALGSGRANFFTDGGAVNAAVLTLPAGMQAPAAYFDGMTIRFRPIATNTGAMTVNVAGLGLKDLRSHLDEPLTGGEVNASIEAVARYVSATGRFVLVRNASVVKRVVFTSSGNYTPTPGVRQVLVECVGGGGGGGGADGPGPGNGGNAGAGGGGGGYCAGVISAASMTPPVAIVIGAGGSAGTVAANGGAGGNTTFGAFLTANGGAGGDSDINLPGTTAGRGNGNVGAGGSATGGQIQIPGQAGEIGLVFGSQTQCVGARGGHSRFGAPARSIVENQDGLVGTGYGSGGGGGTTMNSSTDRNGGSGAPGVVIITEFF